MVGVGHVLTVHSAPDQHHRDDQCRFRRQISAGEVERIVCDVELEARERWPQVRRLFIRPMHDAAAELGNRS